MDLNELEEAAARRLDAERAAKIESITALAAAARKVADTRAELSGAEQAHTAAYAKALRLGWTDTDLKDFNIEQPLKKPVGRPRAAKPRSAPKTRNTEHADKSPKVQA